MKGLNRYFFIVMMVSLGACSKGFNAEPARVNAIKSVAVVSFTVPSFVTEQDEGGFLSGLSALTELVSDVASGEEKLGNGEQVANEAAAGFIETMAATGRWNVLPASKVSSSSAINAMVKTHGEEYLKNWMSMTGTPAIELELNDEQSDYAARAAKALGVDGVMVLTAYGLNYFLYTGVAGTGEAKAQGGGVFKLYDKQGNVVWA